VRYHFDAQDLQAICTALNSDNEGIFADTSLRQNHPEKSIHF
jgi:hypothetical protein